MRRSFNSSYISSKDKRSSRAGVYGLGKHLLERMAGNFVGPKAAAVTRQSDLAGWWKLDESSGTTASDSSSTKNDATLTNATFSAGGKNNNCVDMDGAGDYIIIPSNSVNGTMPVTWSLWINQDSFSNNAAILNDSLYYGDDGEFSMQFRTGGGSYNRVLLVMYDGPGYSGVWYDLDSDSTSGWNHYAVTMIDDGGNTKVRFFFNGTEQTIESTGSSDGGGTVDGNAFTFDTSIKTNPIFWIGRYSSHYINGQIDDIRLYDIQLSDAEIAAVAAGDWP